MSPQTPHTWEDNFLCWQYTPPPAPIDAGAPTTDAGAPQDATTDAGTDAPAPADAQALDVVVPDDVNELVDAVADDAEVWETPIDVPHSITDAGVTSDATASEASLEEPSLREPGGASGCACRAGQTAPAGRPWAVLSLLAVLRRRRRGAARNRSATAAW